MCITLHSHTCPLPHTSFNWFISFVFNSGELILGNLINCCPNGGGGGVMCILLLPIEPFHCSSLYMCVMLGPPVYWDNSKPNSLQWHWYWYIGILGRHWYWFCIFIVSLSSIILCVCYYYILYSSVVSGGGGGILMKIGVVVGRIQWYYF